MTTLILGCGYLGQRIGRQLAERGDRVFGTTRTARRCGELVTLGIEPIVADMLDLASLQQLPVVEHAVYCVGFDRSAGQAMRAVYVDGLRNVLDRLAPQTWRWVFTSSTGVYGQTDGSWVDEDSPTEPQHESGRVMLEAEAVLRERAGQPIIVRLAGLYGPGRVVRRTLLEQREPIPGDPEKFLNLVHVEDAAAAVIAALEKGVPGRVYLAADDRPVTRREYYALAAERLGVPPPVFTTPPADAARDHTNKRIANHRIKREVGVAWRFPDIQTGLADALAGPSAAS